MVKMALGDIIHSIFLVVKYCNILRLSYSLLIGLAKLSLVEMNNGQLETQCNLSIYTFYISHSPSRFCSSNEQRDLQFLLFTESHFFNQFLF